MAYFKQGDLILKQTQKVQVQDVDISFDGTKVEVDDTVKVEGLKIGDGVSINSISNNMSSDSTSEIMTSSSIQDAIDEAVSEFSGSGGAEALSTIFDPRVDVKGSGYNIDLQTSVELISTGISETFNSDRCGVCTLASDLIAVASRSTTDTGISVTYYKDNGDVIDSINLLTTYTSGDFGPYEIRNMLSTPAGKLVSIFTIGSSERYLISVNENATAKIELELPYSDVPHAYGVLPNDEIVVYAYNGSSYSLAIYKPDFDTLSFTVVKEFTPVTDGTPIGILLDGPTIKFIGSNEIAIPDGNGVQIINLESCKYTDSNVFSFDCKCVIEINQYNQIVMVGDTTGSEIYLKVIDFNGNDVIAEELLISSGDHLTGDLPPQIKLLNSGDIIIYYAGSVANNSYRIYAIVRIDSEIEIISEAGFAGGDIFFVDTFPNGNVLFAEYDDTDINIYIMNFEKTLRKELYLSGSKLVDVINPISSPSSTTSVATSDTIATSIGNFNDKVSPFSKNRYMSGSGIFGQGDLDWEYSSTPKWIFNIGDVGSDSYRNYNIRASLLTDGNLCVFYRGTIARNFFAMTLDPTTFEVLNTETWDNEISTDLDFSEEGTLKTWDGVVLIQLFVLSPFPSGTSVLLAYHQNTGWFSLNISGRLKGYSVLDNNNILLFRHNYDESKIETATYTADIDTTSFINVSDWVESTVPLAKDSREMRMTPLGNGKFLCNYSTTQLMEFELNGDSKLISKTDYGVTFGTGFCLDNRIIIIGKDSNSKAKIVILDKQYNLLKTISTEFGTTVTSFTGIPEILSNGDVTFTIHNSDRNGEPIAVFIKPNNDYQITNRYNYTVAASGVNSLDSNPIELPNGDVLYIDYSISANFYIFGRQYKKVNKWTEKIEVLENLNRRNHGTYNQKVVKYQPQLVYKNTAPTANRRRTIGYFNNGKLLIVDIALYNGTHWHPYISILDQNDNLVVNLKPITFNPDVDVNQQIVCEGNYRVLPFKNKNLCLFVVSTASGDKLIIIVDDNGNTICGGVEVPTSSSFTIGLLENDDILLLEYVSSTIPPGYNGGSGSYARTYTVTEDSTSLISLQPPIRTLVLAANGSGNIFPFDSNTMIGIYNSEVNIIDSKTFSIRANRLDFTSLDTGTSSSLQRNPPSFDGKHFYIASRTYIGPGSNLYIAKYKYDRTNEEVSFVNESLVLSSASLPTVAADVYMFSTPNDYLVVPLHSISLDGVYKEGVMILDKNLNSLYPILNDYLYFGATESYSSYECATSRNGEIALLGVGISSYDTYVKKFKPVIEMTSPMNACLDVNYVTDQVTVTTINRKHMGQVIAYSSTTSHTIYVPSDANNDLPLGFTCTLARLSSGDLSIAVDGGGVSISSRGSVLSLRVAGSTGILTKVDRNKWQFSGDLG